MAGGFAEPPFMIGHHADTTNLRMISTNAFKTAGYDITGVEMPDGTKWRNWVPSYGGSFEVGPDTPWDEAPPVVDMFGRAVVEEDVYSLMVAVSTGDPAGLSVVFPPIG